MRVFVLTTGRSGSTTFAKACSHITNYTSAHESLSNTVYDRLDYKDGHIEVDNRLSWFLGSLDKIYGKDPVYVHLQRNPEEVAVSYSERFKGRASIVNAFGKGIIQRTEIPEKESERIDISRLCVQTIEDNINMFLKDKDPDKIVKVNLSDIESGFHKMCKLIGAEIDLDAARYELSVRHNKRRKG